jgi:hypothetical protein
MYPVLFNTTVDPDGNAFKVKAYALVDDAPQVPVLFIVTATLDVPFQPAEVKAVLTTKPCVLFGILSVNGQSLSAP